MNYPHGWSFWSKDEWKALKSKRTSHYAINRVKARGVLSGTGGMIFRKLPVRNFPVKHVKHVSFVDEAPRPTTSYQVAYSPLPQARVYWFCG